MSNSIILGTVDEIRTRDCAFCHRFLNRVFFSSPYAEAMEISGNDVVELTYRQERQSGSGWRGRDKEQTPTRFILQMTISQNIRTPENPLMISAAEFSPVTTLLDGSYNVGPALSLRTVPEQFETATLQAWLQDCTHESSTFDNTLFSGFRCIDLLEECLSDVEVSVSFVALSYVWGQIAQSIVLLGDNIAQLKEKNAISSTDTRFPKTIRDAMTLCKDLGIRYLWVDALCIIQDSTDKMHQIKWLHIIYQRALFTIVAAHGESAEAGLPGVGPGSRPGHQQVSNIQGLRLAQISLDLDIALLSSYWRTRAWTFQEYLLSPRKLIFTQHRIYFACSHGIHTEDLRAPEHSSSAEYSRKLYQSGLEFDLDGMLNWTIYAKLVAAYTTKNISYNLDIIPAFTALASILSREVFGSTPFLFGLPLCMLNAGLLWRRCIGCTECKNPEEGLTIRGKSKGVPSDQRLPSWSWAGWIGHVHFSDWILQNGNPSTTIIPRVTWLNATGNGPRIVPAEITGKPDETWPGWTSWSEKTISGGGGNAAKAYFQQDRNPNRLFCHPVESVSTQSPIPMDLESGVLTFITEVAEFVVYKRFYQGIGKRREKEAFADHLGPAHGNPLVILNPKDSSHIGLLYDDIDIHKIAPSAESLVRCSFIKMSQTTMCLKQEEDPAWNPQTKQYDGVPGGPSVNPDSKADSRKYFDYEKWKWNVPWGLYNVLLVRFDDRVAYRLGVGKICAKAFDEASPVRKTILLA
jgi:hypothetical protein